MQLTTAKGSAEHPQPTRHLRLGRRNDLSLREVTGRGPVDILAGQFGQSFPPVIEWSGGTLLIGTAQGIEMNQFQLPRRKSPHTTAHHPHQEDFIGIMQPVPPALQCPAR